MVPSFVHTRRRPGLVYWVRCLIAGAFLGFVVSATILALALAGKTYLSGLVNGRLPGDIFSGGGVGPMWYAMMVAFGVGAIVGVWSGWWRHVQGTWQDEGLDLEREVQALEREVLQATGALVMLGDERKMVFCPAPHWRRNGYDREGYIDSELLLEAAGLYACGGGLLVLGVDGDGTVNGIDAMYEEAGGRSQLRRKIRRQLSQRLLLAPRDPLYVWFVRAGTHEICLIFLHNTRVEGPVSRARLTATSSTRRPGCMAAVLLDLIRRPLNLN